MPIPSIVPRERTDRGQRQHFAQPPSRDGEPEGMLDPVITASAVIGVLLVLVLFYSLWAPGL